MYVKQSQLDSFWKNLVNGLLDDEVVVEVTGQPGASKQSLYYLALSAANGMVRRFNALAGFQNILAPAYGFLMIEYDAADTCRQLFLIVFRTTLKIYSMIHGTHRMQHHINHIIGAGLF